VHLVLDTNVLVSALRSRKGASSKLLREIVLRKISVSVSVAVLLEYEDVLLRPEMVPDFTTEQINLFLNAFCSTSLHQEIYFSWRPTLSDPSDEILLELAVAAGATHIVTHNKRHFTEASIFGISTVTPSELLNII
jgi:putative PIN family toxin of toxin-antitoxin system